MQVGILTFHFGRNYGALLQAYALRETIDLLGYKAVVLHYIPDYYTGCMISDESNWLRLGWRTLGPKLAIDRRLRTYRFNRFKKKKLHLTKRCRDKRELAQLVDKFDAVVVGSDQVWNLNYLKSDDLCYFLDFPIQHEICCISYAACCGRKDQPTLYASKVTQLLTKFKHFGVRNEVTNDFVKGLTGRTATVVADPTLLVDFNTIEDGYVPESEYILVYSLGKETLSDCSSLLENLKKELGLQVWAIGDGNAQWEDTPFPGADKNWYGISPGRFLSLLKHAACVVTDSFHGTIFSVKYKKPFVTLCNAGWRNMRLADLAKRYGIDHRIKDISHPIDYELLMRADDLGAVQEKFDAHKTISLKFLRNALGGIAQS